MRSYYGISLVSDHSPPSLLPQLTLCAAQVLEEWFQPLVERLRVVIYQAGNDQLNSIASILTLFFNLPSVTFSTITQITSPEVFSALFGSQNEAMCIFAFGLLEKAAKDKESVALLSEWKDTVNEMLLHWLTSSTPISTKAEDVFYKLLETDSRMKGGSYKLWERLLLDSSVLETILKIISWDGPKLPLSRAVRSTAQGRLLSLLKRLAEIDFIALTTPTHPEVVRQYFPGTDSTGIAGVALDAAWVDDDLLMLLNLFDFGTSLLSSNATIERNGQTAKLSKLALAFFTLPEVRLHQEVMGVFSYPENDIDRSLQSSAVDYLVAFCKKAPDTFYSTSLYFEPSSPRTVYISVQELRDSEGNDTQIKVVKLPDHIFGRVETQLHELPPDQSLNALRLLTSVPVQFLLPSESYPNSLVTKIPYRPLTAAGLQALAYFFNPPNASALGRVFYAYYLRDLRSREIISDYTEFFQILSKAIDNHVNLEVGFAALGVLGSIITSNWEDAPPTPLTHTDLQQLLQSIPEMHPQRTGLQELARLTAPLTMLLNNPAQFGSSGARPKPDDPIWETDDNAVKLAKARYALIRKTYQMLQSRTEPELMLWRTAFERRVAMGVMGSVANQVASMNR